MDDHIEKDLICIELTFEVLQLLGSSFLDLNKDLFLLLKAINYASEIVWTCFYTCAVFCFCCLTPMGHLSLIDDVSA